MTSRIRYRAVICGLVVLLALAPALGQTPAPGGTSEISGRLLAADGSAVTGATIVAYHLSTETVHRSAATDAQGRYALTGLPHGYFDLAVESVNGLFVADQVVNVAPAAKSVLTLSLSGGAVDPSQLRAFPGIEREPTGLVTVASKPSGADFWRSPKGVGILAGVGGAALLLLATGGSDDDVSPSGAN